MRSEIAGRPTRAQRRGIRSDLEEEIAQLLALGARDIDGLHVRILAQHSNTAPDTEDEV
jgi:hypothetical protein